MSCRHSFPCQKHFQHPMIFSGHSDRRRWPARFWHARGKRHARRSPQPGGAPAARRRARNVRAVAWHAVSRPHPPPANQTRPVSPKTDCHMRQDAAAASGVGPDTTRRPAEAAEVGIHKDSEQLPPTQYALTSPSTFRKGCRDTHHRSKTTTQSRLDLSGWVDLSRVYRHSLDTDSQSLQNVMVSCGHAARDGVCRAVMPLMLTRLHARVG